MINHIPMADPHGIFRGISSLRLVKTIPEEDWLTTSVAAEIMDRSAHTVCANHSMALVERELASLDHYHVPVVDQETDQLIGILSSSDEMQTRENAKETLQPTPAKVIVM